jgi:outer membrane protein W
MKSLKYFFFLSASLLVGAAAFSQQGTWRLNLNYGAAFPGSSMKTMFNDASLRGWSGAVLYGATDQLSVGLQAGFQDFYQKNDRQVLHEDGSDISAVVTHSVQTMPIMLKGQYKFTTEGRVQPFAGLGIGGNLIQYRKFYGQFSENDTKFGFAAQPEVGVHIPVGRGTTGLQVAAGYNLMPYKYGDADGLNGAFIKAGISFPLR